MNPAHTWSVTIVAQLLMSMVRLAGDEFRTRNGPEPTVSVDLVERTIRMTWKTTCQSPQFRFGPDIEALRQKLGKNVEILSSSLVVTGDSGATIHVILSHVEFPHNNP